MIHTINSDAFKVELNTTGAELSSILSKKSGMEYIWQGNPEWWAGRAPILFPMLCAIKNGTYTIGGTVYNMTKHGFVRYAEFETAQADDKKVVFEYRDNEETLKMYPYKFLLQIIFELDKSTLSTTYKVKSFNESPMYFSIGAHEAYRCPRNEDETFEDYYIEFEKDGKYISETVNENGLITGEQYTIIENGRIIPLDYSLFSKDTLMFKNPQSSKVFLKSKKSKTVLEVDYKNAPYLAIWTKKGAPYVCIEPWFGMPDEENHDGDIKKKLGIEIIEPNGEFSWTHNITIHER
ncbi:MAG: aldose 1-epimerase family protein [Defluviitaleaceae bacterium]|nr:aldose 1-epimerase family protein [Defluviitaleaceae bacterium]